MVFNQHFKKANIEAAVRVALANNEESIYVNGERSKERYMVVYNKFIDSVSLLAEWEKNGYKGQKMLGYVDVSNITKGQRAKDGMVKLITDYFNDRIKYNRELKAA